jgi:hypothetical protein
MLTRGTALAATTLAIALGLPSLALADTGVSVTSNAAGSQYQPGDTGSVPVTPPTDQTPPPPAASPSTAPPVTTATAPPTPTPATEVIPPVTAKGGRPEPKTTPIADVTPTPPATTASTLPYTGLDVIPIALAGLAVLGLGLALRFQTRDRRR